MAREGLRLLGQVKRVKTPRGIFKEVTPFTLSLRGLYIIVVTRCEANE